MSLDHNQQNSHDANKTMDVQALKNLLNASQEYIKLTDLELNVEYDITNGKIINTVHGNRVQLVLNNKYKLLMPDRYAKLLTNEYIQTLVISKSKLMYKGVKNLYNNQTKHDLMFV